MLIFRLFEGPRNLVEEHLNIWAHENPDLTMDDIDMDYQMNTFGTWNVLLLYEEEQ